MNDRHAVHLLAGDRGRVISTHVSPRLGAGVGNDDSARPELLDAGHAEERFGGDVQPLGSDVLSTPGAPAVPALSDELQGVLDSLELLLCAPPDRERHLLSLQGLLPRQPADRPVGRHGGRGFLGVRETTSEIAG